MESHRAASLDDVKMILDDLSDITKSEIAAVSIGYDRDVLANLVFNSGPSEISFSDEIPLFIVGHYPIDMCLRATWCFAGKATEVHRRATLAAAARQVERMMVDHPHDRFVSVSYSQHPKRDWFFAMMGFHKRQDFGSGAVYDLLPVEAERLDS